MPPLKLETDNGLTSNRDEAQHLPINHGLELITGNANPQLAIDIARILQTTIDEPVTFFPDRERRVVIKPVLQDKHVVIIQSTGPAADITTHDNKTIPRTPNDNIVELMLMIDATRRSGAKKITAVIPYFGYSRQDRKEQPRVPISASVMAGTFEFWGVSRLITLDLHSEQEAGFVHIPFDNLYGTYTLLPEVLKLNLRNPTTITPDRGGFNRASAWRRLLNTQNSAVIYKQREIQTGESSALMIIGNVRNHDCLLVDDQWATGGTMNDASELLKIKGARRIIGAVTHGLFLGDSLDILTQSPIETLFVTDTLELSPEVRNHPKIRIISVAPLLAEAIKKTHHGVSLSEELIL